MDFSTLNELFDGTFQKNFLKHLQKLPKESLSQEVIDIINKHTKGGGLPKEFEEDFSLTIYVNMSLEDDSLPDFNTFQALKHKYYTGIINQKRAVLLDEFNKWQFQVASTPSNQPLAERIELLLGQLKLIEHQLLNNLSLAFYRDGIIDALNDIKQGLGEFQHIAIRYEKPTKKEDFLKFYTDILETEQGFEENILDGFFKKRVKINSLTFAEDQDVLTNDPFEHSYYVIPFKTYFQQKTSAIYFKMSMWLNTQPAESQIMEAAAFINQINSYIKKAQQYTIRQRYAEIENVLLKGDDGIPYSLEVPAFFTQETSLETRFPSVRQSLEEISKSISEKHLPESEFMHENRGRGDKKTSNSRNSVTKYGFYIDNNSKSISIIDSIWNALKSENLIHNRTKFSIFRKVFNQGIIKEKIDWLGDINQLYYFVKLLTENTEYNNTSNKNKWQITVDCFKVRGKTIEINQLQRTKNPSSKNRRPILEIINKFKKMK
ncbi:hypothetical protein [Runella salmonicolor]|uniref:Uncharacterized protein n=1 Tax=Runella salmonicolor TaxID=2950278 RepID=A0ABT1FQM8_9BACT|nr:hypothetical protein [Runella salmonicolor]MCP1384057.1 hypothetical protein [Runella salmonicolor]